VTLLSSFQLATRKYFSFGCWMQEQNLSIKLV